MHEWEKSRDTHLVASRSLEIQVSDPLHDGQWDKEVGSHRDATVFHSTAWAKVLVETYRHRPSYVRLTLADRLIALVPVMEVFSRVTGLRGVCVPFADFCAPLIFEEAPVEGLILECLLQLARQRKWKYLEIRSSLRSQHSLNGPFARLSDQRTGAGGGWESAQLNHTNHRSNRERFSSCPEIAFSRFYAHTLDLTQPTDELLRHSLSSVRRAIRKAERSGLSVEITRAEDALLAFYKLHSRTRRRHGLPPQPLSFFRSIHDHILKRGFGFITLAQWQAKPVAAAMFLHFGKNSLYKFGASDERWQALRGNNLIMWESIRYLRQSGFTTLHLGRTDLEQPGLRRFKRSLGAVEQTTPYLRFGPEDGECFSAPGRSALASNVLFRILPVGVNRLAGQLIYPHLH
jgi:hypothetical protein